MSVTTAGDLVRGALGKILVLGTQDTLADADLQTGMDALNLMLDSWSLESLAVFQVQQQTFPVTANVGSYTVGPGGTWNTTRPNRIINAFVRYQSVDYPCQILDRLQYDSFVYKSTQGMPFALFYDRAYPLGTITFYPVPTIACDAYFDTYLPVQTFADPTTLINLPPGYARAIIHCLAVELCPDYNKEPSQSLGATAIAAKAAIKRNNQQDWLSRFDAALMSGRRAYNGWADVYR